MKHHILHNFSIYVSVKNTEQPILILAAHHVVTEQGPDLFEDPVILYETQFNIRGEYIADLEKPTDIFFIFK